MRRRQQPIDLYAVDQFQKNLIYYLSLIIEAICWGSGIGWFILQFYNSDTPPSLVHTVGFILQGIFIQFLAWILMSCVEMCNGYLELVDAIYTKRGLIEELRIEVQNTFIRILILLIALPVLFLFSLGTEFLGKWLAL